MHKSFVTLFTRTRNEHLAKEIGQIPLVMQRYYGFRSQIISRKNGDYPAITSGEYTEAPLRFLQTDYHVFGINLSAMAFLWNEARSIDVLNLFHLDRETLALALVQKLRHPRGIIYLKLDLDVKNFRAWGYVAGRHPILAHTMHWLSVITMRLVDIISIESDEGYARLIERYPILRSKLCIIPNGCDESSILRSVPRLRDAHEKERLIITAGRLGTQQKNTEMLLDAVEKIDLKDWRIVLIGGYTENFAETIRTFYSRNPHLKNRVVFTGPITDRSVLYDYFNRARIFCLTSRWEGSPIVFPESLYFGNYIITTDVSSARYATANGTMGSVVPLEDAVALAHELQKHIDNPGIIESKVPDIRRYAEKFSWNSTMAELVNRINARTLANSR